ncbi:MAG: hypothetical protein RSA57_03885 [Cetobacterium sp.]|uniref:hypothetical protein n=1 Tax=Bacteria TaxID=2 RepID=UPI002FCA2459
MASKSLMYKVNGVPTLELVEKFNEDSNIFFRFQNPHQKLTSRSESWGMIYGSKQEAIKNDCEILPGKSCMDTLKGLDKWITYFDDDYVVLVFEGCDTGVTGHDGEYVATYYKKVAVWSMKDVVEFMQNNYWNE